MFLQLSEETHDHPLRDARTFCKDCEQYAPIRLVERVRTVTLYWVLKSSSRSHFLICDHCNAEFKVKPHRPDDLEYADIHTLLQMAGGRHVPFSDQAMLFLTLLCIPIPVINWVMVFAIWRNRVRYTASMLRWWRFCLWAASAVNAALLIALLLEKPYQP